MLYWTTGSIGTSFRPYQDAPLDPPIPVIHVPAAVLVQTHERLYPESYARRTYADLQETAALKAMLPWLTAHMEEVRAEMGADYWPYGLEKNRETISTFLRYHHEQGLSKRLLAPEDLFAPETLESFKI